MREIPRAAAIWGHVRPRDATASARATRNPAYAGPGFGAAPSARLAPPRLAGGTLCGHEDHLGQVQSIALEVQGGESLLTSDILCTPTEYMYQRVPS